MSPELIALLGQVPWVPLGIVLVVVYCASGARSAQAASILKAAGFTDVTNAGGLANMPRP